MSGIAPKRILFLTLLDDAGSDRIVAAIGPARLRLRRRRNAQDRVRRTVAVRDDASSRLPTIRRLTGCADWLLRRCAFADLVRDWHPDLVDTPRTNVRRSLLREPGRIGCDPAVGAAARSLAGRLRRATRLFCSREGLDRRWRRALGLRTPRQREVASLAAGQARGRLGLRISAGAQAGGDLWRLRRRDRRPTNRRSSASVRDRPGARRSRKHADPEGASVTPGDGNAPGR